MAARHAVTVSQHAVRRYWERRFSGRPLPGGGHFVTDAALTFPEHRLRLARHVQRLVNGSNAVDGPSGERHYLVDGGAFIAAARHIDGEYALLTFVLIDEVPIVPVDSAMEVFLNLDARGLDDHGYTLNGSTLDEPLSGAPGHLRGCDRSQIRPLESRAPGFDREGFSTDTRTRFDSRGYDCDGLDWYGFDCDGIHGGTGDRKSTRLNSSHRL